MGVLGPEYAGYWGNRVPRRVRIDRRLQCVLVRVAARLGDDRRHVRLREPRDCRAAGLAAVARGGPRAHVHRDGDDPGGGGVDSILSYTASVGRPDVRTATNSERSGSQAVRPSGRRPRTRGLHMTPLPRDAVLLTIDVQKGMDVFREKYHRNNPDLERNIARLQQAWRESGRPLIHVQHLSKQPNSPLRPGQPGVEIKDEVRPLPGEPVVQKSVNSAFIGTTLEADLRRRGITTLVMVGLQTNMCVSTTARMAGNLGFTTYVVSDATATFDNTGPDGKRYASELLHDVALADLHGEFATVVDTATILRQAAREVA